MEDKREFRWTKIRRFLTKKRRICPECYRQSSSHAFILFAAKRQLNSSSSDLHSGNLMISAPVSCLLADLSAMAGFRPDSFRCFGTVLCAQLRSSGFPFLLRRYPFGWTPVTVHRMAYYAILGAHLVLTEVMIHEIAAVCKRNLKNVRKMRAAHRRAGTGAREARRSRSRRRPRRRWP